MEETNLPVPEDRKRRNIRDLWPYDDEPPPELEFFEIARERGMLDSQRNKPESMS